MSRSKRRRTQFWQSAWMNDQAYLTYRMWILTLAINRYRWIGLPKTCDPRFLEETLALQGVATISTPEGAALWTSTQSHKRDPGAIPNAKVLAELRPRRLRL